MADGMERNFAYATAMKQLGGKKAVNVKHQRQKTYALPKPGKPLSSLGDYVITRGDWSKASPKKIHGAVRNAVAQKILKPVKARRLAHAHGAALPRQKWAKMWRNMRNLKRGQSHLRSLYPYQLKQCKTAQYALPKPTLEGRLASGAGRFVKRHAGLISMLVAAPAIASEIQRLIQKVDEKRSAENYAAGLGGRKATVLKLVGKAKRKRRFRRGVMSFPRKHPKLSMVAGGAGLGAWGMRRVQKAQEPRAYALPPFVDPAPSFKIRRAGGSPSKMWAATKKVGKPALKAGGLIALGGFLRWLAVSVLQELERKRIPALGPYMPDVVPDIEMARYTINQVVAHTEDISTAQLYAIQDKALQTLATIKGLPHRAKVATEKAMLLLLIGYMAATIQGRGLSTPKRRVFVEGEASARGVPYDQPFDPKEWAMENKAFNTKTRRMVKVVKRKRRRARMRTVRTVANTVRRHPGRAAAATLPWVALAGLITARHKRQKREKYFAAAAAVKGAAKVGKWATARKWGNRAFTAWIAADILGAVVPRKKKALTSVQSGPTYRAPQYYAIARVPVRRLMELRWLARQKVKIRGKNAAMSKSLLEIANRIIAERKVLTAAGVGAGVGGVMVGKQLEKRRIKKAIG